MIRAELPPLLRTSCIHEELAQAIDVDIHVLALPGKLVEPERPIALIAANLFVVAFGMSWGPVVWVLLGEAFPNRIRAAALALAAGAQWVANWLITVSFPSLKDISLGLAYGFYTVCAVLSLVFVLRWVRETKGKTLEDMTGQTR